MADERRPNVFLSHSSDDAIVVKQIKQALEPAFDVFLDNVDLRAGANWQEDIERAIIRCDAAIIVVSPGMLARPAWVSAEAYFLSVRQRHFDQSLIVIPVLLPGVKSADLRSSAISPAKLSDVHVVKLDPAALDVTKLIEGLEPIARDYAARLPYAQIEEVVASLLELNEHAMGLLAKALGLSQDDLTLLADKKRWLGCQMLRADLAKLEAAHLAIAGAALKPDIAANVFRIVAPYCWVPPAAAQLLTSEAIRPAPKRPLGMNASQRRTPHLYVRRASMKYPEWWTFECDGDFSNSPQLKKREDVLLDNIRESLTMKLGFASVPTDAELKDELARAPEGQEPIFVLLPDDFAAMDGKLLKQVRDAFPGITFLFWTKAPDPALTQKFDDLVLLPPFDSTEEGQIYRAYVRRLGKDPAAY